jgi:hypothetical protein
MTLTRHASGGGNRKGSWTDECDAAAQRRGAAAGRDRRRSAVGCTSARCSRCPQRAAAAGRQDVPEALHVVPGARRPPHQTHTAAGADAQRPAGGGTAAERSRTHECAVCGLEFSMRQALGGHMRRHRGEAPPQRRRIKAMPDLTSTSNRPMLSPSSPRRLFGGSRRAGNGDDKKK